MREIRWKAQVDYDLYTSKPDKYTSLRVFKTRKNNKVMFQAVCLFYRSEELKSKFFIDLEDAIFWAEKQYKKIKYLE